MIIHINGFPGVGKLTVAQLLAERLNARLIDNHSLINAARVPWEHGTDEYIELLRRIAAEVYADLAKQPKDEIQIFTNALANEYAPDPSRFKAIQELAARRGVPFVPVLLECDYDENVKRLCVESRADKQKLRDVDVLKDIYANYTRLHPDDHPNQLRIDTTANAPEKTADAILAFLAEKDLVSKTVKSH